MYNDFFKQFERVNLETPAEYINNFRGYINNAQNELYNYQTLSLLDQAYRIGLTDGATLMLNEVQSWSGRLELDAESDMNDMYSYIVSEIESQDDNVEL